MGGENTCVVSVLCILEISCMTQLRINFYEHFIKTNSVYSSVVGSGFLYMYIHLVYNRIVSISYTLLMFLLFGNVISRVKISHPDS